MIPLLDLSVYHSKSSFSSNSLTNVLQGIDNMPQGFDPQVQNAFLQNQGQFQLPPQQQQQQTMARDQGQGNMTNTSLYGQQNANDGSVGYPMPSNSSNVRSI